MNEVSLQGRKRSVLVVQRSSVRDGSAHSGLLLVNGLREAGWDTHAAFGFEGPMIEEYASAGHTPHVVPHDNWLRRERTHQFAKDVWLEWRKASAFEVLIEEIRPEVIYLNTVVSLAGALAARRKGVPCVWHLREMFANVGGEMHAPGWAVPLVQRAVCGLADRLVANSEATAHNLLGGWAEDADIVPNAVRATFFEVDHTQRDARSEFGLSPNRSIIGVPGTLRPMKGHPFFFETVAPLLSERDDLHVVVTGEGASDYTVQLKEKVRDLDIRDRVHFLGWVEDMPAFYRACDLVCIPSRAEPFGRTAIEAFAVGTPVVASAVGGLQDIVVDGETGVLVSYGNEETLGDALCTLLDHPELCRRIAANARQEAEKKYHERVYKDRITTLLAETVVNGDHLSRA